MAQITLSNDQLHLIQRALDLYSRIGILQFWQITEHPSIQQEIENRFTDPTPLKVGDRTVRGEVVKIGKGYIKTKGSWGNGEEIRKWTDVKNVKRSPDWSKVHQVRDEIRSIGGRMAYLISGEEMFINGNGSHGIHHPGVDDSCREAFDLIQVIRHEFWKANPERSNMTVDSSIHFTSNKNMNRVKVKLDKKK